MTHSVILSALTSLSGPKDAGIPMEAAPTDFNVISDKLFEEQDFDAALMGWSLTAYPDHMRWFFHSDQAGIGGFNPQGYSNPEFDKLADKFMAGKQHGQSSQAGI